MPECYVIVALFEFEDYPVYNEFVGASHYISEAFNRLEDFDCKKVIASKYEMDVQEVGRRMKSIGVKEDTGKIFYEERRKYQYQIKGEEEKYPVIVTLTIFQA